MGRGGGGSRSERDPSQAEARNDVVEEQIAESEDAAKGRAGRLGLLGHGGRGGLVGWVGGNHRLKAAALSRGEQITLNAETAQPAERNSQDFSACSAGSA